MNARKIEIIVYEAGSTSELPAEEAALLRKAKEATGSSYAPYSKFNVGAAVWLENGEIICGSNQENAAYPSGLCAERVTLFYAGSRFPDVPIRAIAIASAVNGKENDAPVFPCGSCRQVLLEYETRFGKPVKVIMGSARKIILVNSAHDLLPLSFSL